MIRRILCLLSLALLLMSGFALAQEGFWTRNEDFYYHARPNCAGISGMVPISAEAAAAFSKYECPVCIAGEDRGDDVQAVSRGGTIVVRFSDAWLAGAELTGVFGWSPDEVYRGENAHDELGSLLHGEAYAGFLNSWAESGYAEGRANTPHILSADGALVMSKRHIGAHWYIVVRPKQEFEDQWDMYWRVSSMKLEMEQDVLNTSFDMQTLEETRSLNPERMRGSKPEYEYQNDDLQIQIYNALEGNIAVIREKDSAGNQLENVRLCIEGAHEYIEVSGYAEEEAAIYCCMLTDGELAALQRGALVELRHVEMVNSSVYRISEAEQYSYLSRENDETLFAIAKIDGADPVDDHFRLIMDGEANCFAATADGEPWIYDYTGARRIPAESLLQPAERITPLVWYGDHGVFLAEYSAETDYAPGDLLLADGIAFGERIGRAKDADPESYSCWIMDENGELLGDYGNAAFTLMENGEIRMEAADGSIFVYAPED